MFVITVICYNRENYPYIPSFGNKNGTLFCSLLSVIVIITEFDCNSNFINRFDDAHQRALNIYQVCCENVLLFLLLHIFLMIIIEKSWYLISRQQIHPSNYTWLEDSITMFLTVIINKLELLLFLLLLLLFLLNS